ncbi:protein grainyhead isoform X3 [Folsomia candida]|uniref:protein grainyhead isoform X3 n=1 Tax=Folsomia candida TaxID=158441 RepID=UPI001604E4D4|nr:protein grainyhead isoform X3 [Folsomia candida]
MSSSTEFESTSDPVSSSPGLLVVEGGGGSFEHPLTAATTAMLNINGASDESPGGGFNVFYDIYGKNLQGGGGELLKSDHRGGDIWSPVQQQPKLSNSSPDMTEVFVTASSPLNPKLTSVLRSNPKLKLNNGHNASNTDGGVIVVKQEDLHQPHSPSSPSSRLNGILGVATTDADGYPAFATLNPSHYDYSGGGGVISQQQFSLRTASSLVGGYSTEPYYRDYFPPDYVPSNATRVISGYDGPTGVESYRATIVGGPYKNPVTIDVNSPDSGIGAESITPRDHSTAQPGFDYNEMVGQGLMGEMSGASSNAGSATGRSTPASTPNQKATRPWHEFGRTSETDKIQIPKLFLNCGFRYYLESPISTSQRREDDRITYINKGQFYGITLDFLPDQEKPLKSQTVKSVVMLVFREEKSPEDEIKAWQFWHSRQHSVKQRILDADTKNSVGLVGCIDEVAHNAIAVYWNPLESSAKINVAVQCLSTDFSSQKGVKGLPLHLQIDTYDDPRDPNCPIYHRGYSQIKVFCDKKGAERKTRDEERRAAKRKLTATGRKKLDELYHTATERTEFYAMSDLAKPPVLFSPAEDLDKVNLTPLAEFHGYYGGGGGGGGGSAGGNSDPGSDSPNINSNPNVPNNAHHHHHHHRPPGGGSSSNRSSPSPRPVPLKFHHNFPLESPPPPTPPPQPTQQPSIIVRTPIKQEKNQLHLSMTLTNGGNKDSSSNNSSTSILLDPHNPHDLDHHHHQHLQQQQHHHHHHQLQQHDHHDPLGQQDNSGDPDLIIPMKRLRSSMPPSSERLMIYVRQEGEDVFTPVHLAPPTTLGLLAALEDKFKISMGSVKNLLRRSGKGVVAKVDDEMLKHYCHEDTFLLEVKASENEDAFDVTLAELCMEMVVDDQQQQVHDHNVMGHGGGGGGGAGGDDDGSSAGLMILPTQGIHE